MWRLARERGGRGRGTKKRGNGGGEGKKEEEKTRGQMSVVRVSQRHRLSGVGRGRRRPCVPMCML